MARARTRSGRRTDYIWEGATATVSGVDLTLNTATILSNNSQGLARTLMRSRGSIFLQLDAGGNDERVLIGLGLILASQEAVTAGVASIPKPIVEIEADWIWHSFVVLSSLAESAVTGDSSALWARVEIDSKAMRKVKPNQNIVLVAQVGQVVDATGTFDVMAGQRRLMGS